MINVDGYFLKNNDQKKVNDADNNICYDYCVTS